MPQVFPNGEQGLTISSGVFQIDADLPFLYPVDITEEGYTPVTTFNQYLSHYHSPVACLYESASNNMHSIFFGGMSQYYYQDGNLIKDDLVPFVKTISRLTRGADGNLAEYQLPLEMPALKGSSAEFILNLDVPHYSNKVIQLDEINQNSFMIGHIFGGIQSPSLNPFSNNQTALTNADTTIFEVWLTYHPLSLNEFEINGENPFEVFVSPNPFKNEFSVNFNAHNEVSVSYFLTNSLGQIIFKSGSKQFSQGDNTISVSMKKGEGGEHMMLTMIFDDKFYVTKKLVKK